jgi:hypothetical protein
MGGLNALSPTRITQWLLVSLACAVWAISAALKGSSAFAVIAVPLLVLVWVAAVLLLDRWVKRGFEYRSPTGHGKDPDGF